MNLLEALEVRGIEFKPHTSRENEVFLCCPFCVERGETPDQRFRFGVNYVTGQAHCFNCGKKFRDFEYLKKALQEKLDTGEWKLAQEAIHLKRLETPVVKLPDDFVPLASLFKVKYKTHWDKLAIEYLHRRGVTNQQIKEKTIGYSMVGDFRYRIVIPVYYQGKLEGIVARAFVTDLEPKYRNSLGNKTLYNVPKKLNKTAILSEGAFDALAIERSIPHGMDSLGVLGHTLTERQLEICRQYKRIILWTDPDVAGVRGIISMGRQLTELKGPKVDAVVPKLNGSPEYEPSELLHNERWQKIKNCEPYTLDLEISLKAKLAFKED